MKAPDTTPFGSSNRDPVAGYSHTQPPALRAVCDLLHELILKGIPKATSKVWHGHPVWFLDDNPVVGYNATSKSVNLLFWNGQTFEERALKPMGKALAAQAVFREIGEIDATAVRRWLRKAKADVFDSKAYFAALRKERKEAAGEV